MKSEHSTGNLRPPQLVRALRYCESTLHLTKLAFHYFLTVDETELLIVTFGEDGLPYGILTRNPDLVRAHVHQFLRFWERG